jgi:hypothetical protein
LDFLLRSRKQFGLWDFFFATCHVIATMYVVNSLYLTDWFRQPIASSNLTTLKLDYEVALLFGILAYVLLVILALTSVNAIGSTLTMTEWRFVQARLDSAFFSIQSRRCHVPAHLQSTWRKQLQRAVLVDTKLVLAVRLLLSYFPPLSRRLDQIRNGTFEIKAKSRWSLKLSKWGIFFKIKIWSRHLELY